MQHYNQFPELLYKDAQGNIKQYDMCVIKKDEQHLPPDELEYMGHTLQFVEEGITHVKGTEPRPAFFYQGETLRQAREQEIASLKSKQQSNGQ